MDRNCSDHLPCGSTTAPPISYPIRLQSNPCHKCSNKKSPLVPSLCDRLRTQCPSSSTTCSNDIHRHKNRWKGRSRLVSNRHSDPFYSLITLSLVLLVAMGPVPAWCNSNAFDLWENEITLDGNDNHRNFVVQWTPSEDRIVFRVTARTRGYIGFGFHNEPKMDGADIVVGWVHSGKLYLQDRYGKGNEAPHVDRQQDWDLIGGFENDTHTVLIMSRPFVTCDANDHPITNDTVRLLWAFHPDDPVDPESPRPRLHYHGGARRGATTLFLLQRAKETMPRRPLPINYPRAHFNAHTYQPPDPPLHSWSLVGPPATIASGFDSVHWCRIFKRPHLDRKHHVVRYEPVLASGGAPYVQHMMMYECIRLTSAEEDFFEEFADTEGSDCSVRSMQTLLTSCNQVVVAWALGSEGVWLPPEAGYPLIPDGPLFYMLETHYDVPTESSILDSSGVRLLHTPVLRNYDAGILSVGLHPNWKHIIPPHQESVLSEGHCVKECTHAAFPSSGINVFGVIFHTHMLGRQVRLRHIRNDVEFEPIASDFNYDFNYQEYRALRHPRKVFPGDHLIGECVYNSNECSSITLGGFKARDEMCLSFLFYFPKVDLSLCHSKPSLGTVLQSLGIQELSEDSSPITIRLPVELAGKSLKWRLQNYDWENHSEHFQEATHGGTFNTKCRAHNFDYPMSDETNYPNVTKPWKASEACERPRRKEKRRRKKPARPQADGSELMADDETRHKLIERIDADPVRSFDVFMPVIDDSKVEAANLDQEELLREETLKVELDQMEVEVGIELHEKMFPGATAAIVPSTLLVTLLVLVAVRF